MFPPDFRRFPAQLAVLVAIFLGGAATGLAQPGSATSPRAGNPKTADGADSTVAMPTVPTAPDTGRSVDSAGSPPITPRPRSDSIPDSSWRWPVDARALPCRGPLEGLTPCWRDAPDRALMETGFPGIRATALNLRSLEPARTEAHFQAALGQSPYGTGGHIPFARYETNGARGIESESWTPVQPLDTPVTDLHWMRGAMLMNQFVITVHRMVGNRAYVALDYGSSSAIRQFYDYTFQVHQPYIGSGRDSLSMVIQDTSHNISARHMRARLGFWLDARTVIEAHGDWLTNSSSMANPANAGRNDSTQLLYPASFEASTFGAVVARGGDNHALRLDFRHAAWDRTLSPRGDTRFFESATGVIDAVDARWTLTALPGAPRFSVSVENTVQDGALWKDGASGASKAAAGARGDRETLAFDLRPHFGLGGSGTPGLDLSADLRAEATRRARQDGVVEQLGGADGDARVGLPFGFHLNGGAGWNREGAPEDRLFRWQPALGLYPNPDLTPRTHSHFGAGAGWTSHHFGFGAAWENHAFADNWLPRVLPQPDACDRLADTLYYPGVANTCAGGPYGTSLPDSVALALVNYGKETRDLIHIHGHLALGNWKLTLRNTYLLKSAVSDSRLGFTAVNWQVPQNVLKGQLLWKRRVLEGKLGLQTRFDWEWYSPRYAFAADMDGTSRVIPLDEYLALDFTTQMEIKSFTLFFRTMNLYHDRYATEPGVHPPGVNFRFGVDWRLRN